MFSYERRCWVSWARWSSDMDCENSAPTPTSHPTWLVCCSSALRWRVSPPGRHLAHEPLECPTIQYILPYSGTGGVHDSRTAHLLKRESGNVSGGFICPEFVPSARYSRWFVFYGVHLGNGVRLLFLEGSVSASPQYILTLLGGCNFEWLSFITSS